MIIYVCLCFRVYYQDLGGETRKVESFEHNVKAIDKEERQNYLNMETKQ